MSVNRTIIDALAPTGVPVKFQVYSGSSPTYITFFMVVGVPRLHVENKLKATEKMFQIDVFSKTDYTSLVEKVKEQMEIAGFLFSSEREFYESDTGFFHYVLTYKLHVEAA